MSAQPRRTARVATLALAGVLLTAGCAAGQVAQTAYERPSLDGSNITVGNIDLRAIAIQAPPDLTATYRTGSDAFLNAVFVNNGQSADRLVGIRTTAATSWSYFSDHNEAFAVQQAGNSPSASASSSASSPESASASTGATPSGTQSTPSGTESTPSGTESAPSGTGSTGTSASSDSTGAADTSTSPASSSSTPLPTGTKSVGIPVGARVGFGTPESTGGLLLTGLTKALNPGDSVRITFTFAKAGSVSVAVPVQLSELPRTAEVPGGEGGG